MAKPTSFSFCMMIIFAATLMNIFSGCYGSADRKLLFVIGDSLFDPGNNKYLEGTNTLINHFPYGMSLHNHSTGRYSDGLVLPDFIGLFANKKIPPAYLEPGADFSYGVNFASGGGRVLAVNSSALNLPTQLSYFNKVVKSIAHKVGDKEAKKVLMRSVYLFSLGGNDYFRFNSENPTATEAERVEYVRIVVGNLTNGFKEIYGKGGRKFAIQNVGPIGCYANIRQQYYSELKGDCYERFSAHARLHNKALSNALKKMSSELPGFKYSILDYNHALGDRIDNPKEYGYKEGKRACCGTGKYNGEGCGVEPYNLCSNPSEYVLFDGNHHTMRTNHQLAELIWNGKPSITGPYNVKQLFDLP